MDNYFKERKDTPRLPDGSYDFESLGALDTDLFNEQLHELLQGKTVTIPHFSFHTGTRSYRDQKEQLGDDGVLIVEGIHGLNEAVSSSVPRREKMKIYISALTPLSFDDYNRIPTTDMRLLRRMVRDSLFRSHDAITTIQNWHKVRAGEEKYIFLSVKKPTSSLIRPLSTNWQSSRSMLTPYWNGSSQIQQSTRWHPN